MKFQKIEDMRIDNDKTIKEVAEHLGIHRDVYSRYEKGIRQFPADLIISLAQYYDCTTDYLLGVAKEKEHYKGK